MPFYKIKIEATEAREYLVEAATQSAAAKLVIMQPVEIKTLNTLEAVSMVEAGAHVVRAVNAMIDTVTAEEHDLPEEK